VLSSFAHAGCSRDTNIRIPVGLSCSSSHPVRVELVVVVARDDCSVVVPQPERLAIAVRMVEPIRASASPFGMVMRVLARALLCTNSDVREKAFM
jgi:hypothetical protein